MQFIRYQKIDELHQALILAISQAAEEAIASKGFFSLVLAGGNTPKPLYEKLAKTKQQWDKWHLLYGDERHLELGHADRNSSMVEEFLIRHLPQAAQHHLVPFSGDIEQDAAAYSADIAAYLPIDFALLGIGEDGHTASLFPNTAHQDVIAQAVYQAPKPPAERISLSKTTLQKCRQIAYFATGDAKLPVIEQGLAKGDLPFAEIANKNTNIHFIS